MPFRIAKDFKTFYDKKVTVKFPNRNTLWPLIGLTFLCGTEFIGAHRIQEPSSKVDK
jgi:hypothetical protein